jgi:hypothetical protein
MKIDNIDQPKGVYKASAVGLPKENNNVKFTDVLNESIPSTEVRQEKTIPSVVSPLATPMAFHPNNGLRETDAACDLLDTLAHYQEMLADPSVSLRTIAPAVEKMEHAADRADATIDCLPDDHPLKALFSETLVSIHQEVERFKLGYYVDG